MSMNAIASGAGITKPSLYYYFRSKEALTLGLLEEIEKTIDLGQHYDLREWTQDNFAVRFRALGRKMMAEYHEDLLFSKVLKQYSILALTNDNVKSQLSSIQENQRQHFEKILRHGAVCGVVDPAAIEDCIEFLVLLMRTISEEIPSHPDKSYSEVWGLGIKAVITRRLGY